MSETIETNENQAEMTFDDFIAKFRESSRKELIKELRRDRVAKAVVAVIAVVVVVGIISVVNALDESET